MAVNLLGNPNDFDRIKQMIGDRDILLLEDNCESMGAMYAGKQAGTFGIMGSFSSFFSHHISTMEGGMIVTDDEELSQILVSLRAHGWTRGLPRENHIAKLSDDPFFESFRFVLPGYNVRPLEMSGAIGLCQLEKLQDLVKSRRDNARLFQELFSCHDLFSIQQEIGESSWFGFSLVLREGSGKERKEIIELFAKNGIETRPIVAGNITRNPVVKYFNYEIHNQLKHADWIHENGFFIGNHHYPLDEQLNYLASLI